MKCQDWKATWVATLYNGIRGWVAQTVEFQMKNNFWSKYLGGYKLVSSTFWWLTLLEQPEWIYQGLMMLKRESLNVNWGCNVVESSGEIWLDHWASQLKLNTSTFISLFTQHLTYYQLALSQRFLFHSQPLSPCHLSWALSVSLSLSLYLFITLYVLLSLTPYLPIPSHLFNENIQCTSQGTGGWRRSRFQYGQKQRDCK